MINELTRLIQVNHRNFERISQLETEKEEQKRKFDEIKSIFDKLSKENNENSENQAMDQTINVCPNVSTSSNSKALLTEMQNKIGEFEKIAEKEEEIMNTDEEINTVNILNLILF